MVGDLQGLQPDFLHPPVVEAIIGVQFEPIVGFTFAHFGLFWQHIRRQYGKIEFREPSPPIPQYANVPPFLPLRAWFLDDSGAQLVQLQNDRIVYNWRKAGKAEYPHYDNMRPVFESLWQTLMTFLNEEGFSIPGAAFCEVTYINHIGLEGIKAISPRLNESFLMLPSDPPSIAKDAGLAEFMETLQVPPDQIQLRLALASISSPEQISTLQFQISALSKLATSESESVFTSLDACHRLAVRAFVEGTSETLHQLWGRGDKT